MSFGDLSIFKLKKAVSHISLSSSCIISENNTSGLSSMCGISVVSTECKFWAILSKMGFLRTLEFFGGKNIHLPSYGS